MCLTGVGSSLNSVLVIELNYNSGKFRRQTKWLLTWAPFTFFFLVTYWRSSLFGIWFTVVQRFYSMNHQPNFNSLRATISWQLPTRTWKKGSLRGHNLFSVYRFFRFRLSPLHCAILYTFKFAFIFPKISRIFFALNFLPHNYIHMPYLYLSVKACRGKGTECGFCLHEEVTECCCLAFLSSKQSRKRQSHDFTQSLTIKTLIKLFLAMDTNRLVLKKDFLNKLFFCLIILCIYPILVLHVLVIKRHY